MNPTHRHQLLRLDRALLALLEERARLVRITPEGDTSFAGPDVDDLLARSRSVLDAGDLRGLLARIDRACRGGVS